MIMKKMQMLLFGLTMFLAATAANGQSTAESSKDESPYIEVMGTAEKEVIPDEIFIKIIILEKFVGKEKQTVEMQEENLKSALKEIGVKLSALSLTDVHSDYIRINWTKKDVIAKKEYTLLVADAATVGQVFQQLEKLDINGAYISMINHTKLDSLRKETRILAIEAAKAKADYLLRAIGEETGKALVIQERDFQSTIPNNGLNIRGSRGDSEVYFINGVKVRGNTQDKDLLQFEKIKIQAAIYVKFSIQ